MLKNKINCLYNKHIFYIAYNNMVTWNTSFEHIVLTILALVNIIIFWGAIYAFILAIFQFIFSKWDPEKVKKAWNNIRYMILWVIFSIFLLLLFPLIFQRLKITWYKVYTASNIFKRASELVKWIISWTKTSNTFVPWNDYSDYEL